VPTFFLRAVQDLHAGRQIFERDPEIEHQDALFLFRAPALASGEKVSELRVDARHARELTFALSPHNPVRVQS